MMNIITTNIKDAKGITHGGLFHADEVMATVILSKVIPDFKVARVFQITDEVNANHIVYDIGFGELDHHQEGGNGRRENGTPYAACGLVFKKYGHKLFEGIENGEIAFNLMDKKLIAGIDAFDNGEYPKVDYPVTNLNISQIVRSFNSNDSDLAFEKACIFAETIFDNIFASCCEMAKNYAYLEQQVANSTDSILVLDHYVDWSETLFEIPGSEKLLFVIYPSLRGGYNWQTIPTEPGMFTQRKSVPTKWWGKNSETLPDISGIEDAIFCHKNGFIGSCETLESAIKMTRLAVDS